RPGLADRGCQIACMNPGAWSCLSKADHHLLCELGEPHGPLFTWLDAHVHENGPEPWEALREAIAGHEAAPYLLHQVATVPADIEHDLDEQRGILQLERERLWGEEMRDIADRPQSGQAGHSRLQ